MKVHRVFIYVFLAIAALLNCAQENDDGPLGHLIIIGGGNRPESIMQKFVDLANQADSTKIFVLPMASSIPFKVGPRQAEEIRNLGGQNVSTLHFTREQADQDSVLNQLSDATGIFISGGVQSRFMDVVRGTAAERIINQLYRKGAVIAGTSAGAAVQSNFMITGDENYPLSEDSPFSRLISNNIVTVKGLGLIDDAIIDQHFIARRRNNRLLSLVIENPALLGIGIDESTAIWIKPDRTFEVLGNNSVVLYDAKNAEILTRNPQKPSLLESKGISLHILKAGAKFDLDKRKVIQLSNK